MSFSKEWGSLDKTEVEIIRRYHAEFPVKVVSLAKELGLSVKKSTLDPGISGEIKWNGDQFIIRVNRHDPEERQRFTLAHEIAHFLLHRDEIGNGIRDDVLYRSSLSNRLEAQANRLAADILMPYDGMKDLLKKYKNLKRDKKIERVAQELNVSIVALKIRLGLQ